MPHRAEHVHPAIYIVNIRTDLLTHGNAVAGAGGACKDMNELLSLIVVEQGLHLVHDLPITRECAGHSMRQRWQPEQFHWSIT